MVSEVIGGEIYTLALYAPSIALAATRRYNCIIDAKAVGGEGANSELVDIDSGKM